MSKFSKGDKVINSNTGEKGFIIEVYPPRRGRQLYKVKYNDRENDENSVVLAADVDLTDPFERCRQNYYDHYSEFLKGNTSFKIQSSNKNTISSLKASRTLFRAYQFKPLLKFLNSDNKRILIADEVGLGKTIEAGHIMLELKARGEFRNVLVICPVSLRAKWATELNDKFGLEFIEIDKKEQLLQELRHHNGTVRAVINYEKIQEASDILKYIEEKNIKFSLIVCDESHKLRNNNTLKYRGAEKLLLASDSVVFMSATPIMIDEYNLYNQLHLLDADMYDNPEVFRNNIQLNRPFVRALSQLNSGAALTSIAEELENSEVTTYNTINDIESEQNFKIGDYFKEYPIYQDIISSLQSGKDTPSLRAQIQFNLSEMSPMNTIFSRTRKREVTQDWSQAERNPYTYRVSMTADERQAYEEVIDDYIEEHTTLDEYGREHTGQMGLVTVKRQLASSVWACKSENDCLDNGYDEFADFKDPKFEALLKILQTVFAHGNKKIIIFAIFKKTLKYLKIRLAKSGYKSAIIYGDPKINKSDVLQQFQYDDSYQVLLSSEVGSEGLDMQFCNSLVNYDLPWNPMVVEQRIGRIDRFGQESKKVNIYNIVVTESILEDIYSRLLMRIGIFRESIGDLEAILDSEMEQDGKKITIQDALKNIERDFYSDKLTEKEVEKKKTEIERAIENERLNLKNIEEGLTNALTNDSYFRDEINKIVNNNAYVTSHELYLFVVQIIKEHLKTCNISQTDDPEVYEFEISKSDPLALKKFLQQYEPTDRDGQCLFRKYIDEIDDKLSLKMTFDQERAFKEKKLTFINIYHPIIRAGVRMFEEKRDKKQCTFFFELSSAKLPKEIKKSRYMLAIYKISVSRNLFDKPMITDSLYPILYDLDANCIIENHELAEKFMGRAQVDGRYAPMEDSFRLNSEMIDDLRYDIKDCVDTYVAEYRKEIQNRIDNSKKLRYQQTIQYYDSREKNYERNIGHQETLREYAIQQDDDAALRNAEGALRLMTANLRDLRQKRESDLERINKDVQLKVTEEIKSLNLVQVV
ncbi:MAG: DEAD/DEAH box helicase [Bacteroidaceae bacterium]|nr:DEAD/DEAH box helicase [Bacteroidaceae bacterium]